MARSYAEAGWGERALVIGFALAVVGGMAWMVLNLGPANQPDDREQLAIADPPTPAPTQEPTPTVTPTPTPTPVAAPTSEATATPTPTPTPTETSPFTEEELAEVRALADLGGPAEIFGPAEQAKQLTNPLHARYWDDFSPGPLNSGWEWGNKDELWNEVTSWAWDDAVQRYGTRIHPRPSTVWPGADTSGNKVFFYSSHLSTDGLGQFTLACVALTSEDAGQRRPDLAVYAFQIRVSPTDDPDLWLGEVHRMDEPFFMPGTIPWDAPGGGQVADFLSNSPDPDPYWEVIQ